MKKTAKCTLSFVQRTSNDIDSLIHSSYGNKFKYSVETESGLVELDILVDDGKIFVDKAKLSVRINPISEIIIKKAQIVFINLERNFPDFLLGHKTPQSLARDIHLLNYHNCIKAN